VGLRNSLYGHLAERATSRWALVYVCGSLGYTAGWGEVGDKGREGQDKVRRGRGMCCVHGGEGGQHTKIEVSTLKLEDRGCTEPRRPE